jgi:glyoxylase-like metal-dependent hydrolase (beta-lactamase superfamily II)/rhodanese-related sulfurtransferase
MIFKQLFDQDTWTFTYLLADSVTREAIIIDPVVEKVERDLKLIDELGLDLIYSFDTHVHADHVTGSGLLRERAGAQTVVSEAAAVACADRQVRHGDRLRFGSHEVEVRSTPGHTDGCATYVVEADGRTMAFTGDALFIRGCGRTDFQQGDAGTLYRSVHGRIFSLPADALVYPGHDYQGHTSTTVDEERLHNPRLKTTVSEADFIEIMKGLNLSDPKRMDVAVPANLGCGVAPKVQESPSTLQEVSPASLADVSRYRVLDVRQPEEFEGRLGHLPGAELVPLATVRDAAATWFKDKPLLVVCKSGVRAASAGRTLLEMGFRDVTNLRGGMMAWNRSLQAPPPGGRP